MFFFPENFFGRKSLSKEITRYPFRRVIICIQSEWVNKQPICVFSLYQLGQQCTLVFSHLSEERASHILFDLFNTLVHSASFCHYFSVVVILLIEFFVCDCDLFIVVSWVHTIRICLFSQIVVIFSFSITLLCWYGSVRFGLTQLDNIWSTVENTFYTK